MPRIEELLQVEGHGLEDRETDSNQEFAKNLDEVSDGNLFRRVRDVNLLHQVTYGSLDEDMRNRLACSIPGPDVDFNDPMQPDWDFNDWSHCTLDYGIL